MSLSKRKNEEYYHLIRQAHIDAGPTYFQAYGNSSDELVGLRLASGVKNTEVTREVLDAIPICINEGNERLKEETLVFVMDLMAGYIRKLCKDYQLTAHEMEDAISDCQEAIFKHLPKYDPNKGMLTTFFAPMFQGAIGKVGGKKTLSDFDKRQYRYISHAITSLNMKGKSDPTSEEIKEEARRIYGDNVKISSGQYVENLLARAEDHLSLDAEGWDPDLHIIGGQGPNNPEYEFIMAEEEERINAMIEGLGPSAVLMRQLYEEFFDEQQRNKDGDNKRQDKAASNRNRVLSRLQLYKEMQKKYPGLGHMEFRRLHNQFTRGVIHALQRKDDPRQDENPINGFGTEIDLLEVEDIKRNIQDDETFFS